MQLCLVHKVFSFPHRRLRAQLRVKRSPGMGMDAPQGSKWRKPSLWETYPSVYCCSHESLCQRCIITECTLAQIKQEESFTPFLFSGWGDNGNVLRQRNLGAWTLWTLYCRFIPVEKREASDHMTHKWMVYVRGSRDDPAIDSFVQKVWFFLHPSYRPNDLVQVR